MRGDGHYETIHGPKHSMRPCQGNCGTSIPAYGGKKWCASCDAERYRVRQNLATAKRRAKKRAAKAGLCIVKDVVHG